LYGQRGAKHIKKTLDELKEGYNHGDGTS